MAHSSAATPTAYVDAHDPARAAEIAAVRNLVNAALPAGYVERMAWGIISWEVPLEVSGPTYNGQPLVYAGLAAQKNYNAVPQLRLRLGRSDRAEGASIRRLRAQAQRGEKLHPLPPRCQPEFGCDPRRDRVGDFGRVHRAPRRRAGALILFVIGLDERPRLGGVLAPVDQVEVVGR
ncbi:MAG: hypothetical protein ABIP91_00315, partial [Sphingomicrobium sp.]